MPDDFARVVERWHDFYLLVGTASATLVGLLFIALTLNVDLLHRDEYGAARTLARQSFACFINLLTIAGVMLIPEQSPSGVGIPLISIGGISLFFTIRSMAARRRRGESGTIGEILRYTALMIVGMVALVGLGIFLCAGHSRLLIWLTVAALTLLSAASNNAWALLTTARRTTAPPPARAD